MGSAPSKPSNQYYADQLRALIQDPAFRCNNPRAVQEYARYQARVEELENSYYPPRGAWERATTQAFAEEAEVEAEAGDGLRKNARTQCAYSRVKFE